MKWHKLGQVYHSEEINRFLLTHASNPVAIHLSANIFRVFFSGRDKSNRSSVGYIDLDIIEKKVINVCQDAIFTFSDGLGSFFSHGVSIGNTYKSGGKTYMLFMAWQIPKDQHWRGDIGRLLLSNENDNLELVGKSPLLSLDDTDPISLSYPWVMYDEGMYKMWYGSTVTWKCDNGEMIHTIKYATSFDGESWKRHGIAVPYLENHSQAFSRPSVIKDKNGYHMWNSVRSGLGEKYRIGYSHSEDGSKWTQSQFSGIDVSPNGWDSEMICYPFVFKHNGQTYMLYNGNNYGKFGFGLAVLDKV